MRDLLERIDARVKAIENIHNHFQSKYDRIQALMSLHETADGYCSTCYLPRGAKHLLSHNILSAQPSVADTGKSLRKQYGEALGKLSDYELSGMALPTKLQLLWLIREEVQKRVSALPEKAPRSAWEWIGMDEDDD